MDTVITIGNPVLYSHPIELWIDCREPAQVPQSFLLSEPLLDHDVRDQWGKQNDQETQQYLPPGAFEETRHNLSARRCPRKIRSEREGQSNENEHEPE